MEEFREILIKDAPKTGLDPSTVMPNIKPVLEYKLGRLIIKVAAWFHGYLCYLV